jgi:RHS repeat-associated protein
VSPEVATPNTFGYNALGQRTRITDSTGTTYFVWDGIRITHEHDGQGDITRRYTYGQSPVEGIGGILDLEDAGGDHFFYHFDQVGGVPRVTAQDEATAQAFEASPFGRCLHESGSAPNPFASPGNYLRLQDRNGTRLSPTRTFDATLGRFIQRDTKNHEEGNSLYVWPANDPVDSRDPEGAQDAACFARCVESMPGKFNRQRSTGDADRSKRSPASRVTHHTPWVSEELWRESEAERRAAASARFLRMVSEHVSWRRLPSMRAQWDRKFDPSVYEHEWRRMPVPCHLTVPSLAEMNTSEDFQSALYRQLAADSRQERIREWQIAMWQVQKELEVVSDRLALGFPPYPEASRSLMEESEELLAAFFPLVFNPVTMGALDAMAGLAQLSTAIGVELTSGWTGLGTGIACYLAYSGADRLRTGVQSMVTCEYQQTTISMGLESLTGSRLIGDLGHSALDIAALAAAPALIRQAPPAAGKYPTRISPRTGRRLELRPSRGGAGHRRWQRADPTWHPNRIPAWEKPFWQRGGSPSASTRRLNLQRYGQAKNVPILDTLAGCVVPGQWHHHLAPRWLVERTRALLPGRLGRIAGVLGHEAQEYLSLTRHALAHGNTHVTVAGCVVDMSGHWSRLRVLYPLRPFIRYALGAPPVWLYVGLATAAGTGYAGFELGRWLGEEVLHPHR